MKSVEITRDISSYIQALSASLDQKLQALGNIHSGDINNTSSQNEKIEQVVHITAEFPNATDKDSIYAALQQIFMESE